MATVTTFELLNFLAHFYLSGNDRGLRIGNFIADSVKGNAFNNWEDPVRCGILLHRHIDQFTDSHPVVIHTKSLLHPYFHHYSGVVSDVYYDHFLAANWAEFSSVSLEEYAAEIYTAMKEEVAGFPERPAQMLPFMISNNWLCAYAKIDGIDAVMRGMARRAKFESGMEKSGEVLRLNYSELEADFREFFPQLQESVNDFLIKYTKA